MIVINAQQEIYTIQEEFNEIFPYLKLDFFLRSYPGSGLPKRMISPRKTIEECSLKRYQGILTITPGMTVSNLEQDFAEYYGIEIHVLRKLGKIWLETTHTNEWTLCRQNKEGELITRELAAENRQIRKKNNLL
jgi:hypothetical protein